MTGFSTRLGLLVLFIPILYIGGCQQSRTAENTLKSVQNDSIALWINRAQNDTNLSKTSKKALLKKVLASARASLPDSLKTKYYSEISLAYKRLGDTMAFRQVNTELITVSKKINDLQAHGEAHWDLGDFYKITKPDSSYYHYREAYVLFLNTDLDKAVSDYPGRMLYAMAYIKDSYKDYVGAEKDVVEAIEFFKNNGYNERLFSAYNLLANIQNGLNNLKRALEYHKKAGEYIQFRNQRNQYRDSIININNKGNAYIRNYDYTNGIKLLKEVLQKDSIGIKFPITYARALASLAEGKIKNGDTDTKNMKLLLQESNKILDSLGDTYFKARNHEFMAEVLAFEKDTAQAIQEALVAKTIAQETYNNDRLLSSLELLTKIDKARSASYSATYFALSDSLQAQERSIRDKFARIEMETDEYIEENESLARQIQTWIGIALGVLLLAAAIFIIRTLRIKNQKLRFKQKQQESNQEIYNLMLSQQAKFQEGKQLEQKRVSEELHDGILGQMLGIRLILSELNEHTDEVSITQRADLIEKLQELEEEIRTISHELNEASYQKIHNFILAIDDLVKTMGASAQWQSSFSYDENVDWDTLDGETKINLYRIVQECLQNCVKHAQCENVKVDFKSGTKSVTISIADDGQGFNKNKEKKGIGMKNITSRVDKMSGIMQVDSKIGGGTRITVTVPRQGQVEKIVKTKAVLDV